MKKVLLSLGMLAVSMQLCFSQDSLSVSKDDGFKARKGHFTTELNINPIKGELSLNNALNQIKFRYFTSDNFALRLGFTLSSKKSNLDSGNPYGTNPTTYNEDKKTSTKGINLGIEKHFKGTNRLSPYLAGEISLASKSSSHDIDNGNTKIELEGGWRKTVYPNNNYIAYEYEERAFTQIGVNIILGFDFYIAKNLYLGYELGMGVSNKKYKDLKTTTITTSPNTNPSPTPESTVDEKEFSFGPSLINGIRLGYAF